MTYTAKEKAVEAEREVEMRVHTYKGRVAAGRMKQRTADRQTEIMREIAEDYRKLAERERLI